MPDNFVADSFHTKNSVADFFQATCNFWRKLAVLRFESPFEGLRGNVRWSYAHWKAGSGLPIGVNWTFFAWCYGWRATTEYPLKIGDFAPTGPVDQKFQVEAVAPTNHSSSQKTTLNILSYGIKIWTDLSSVLSQSTRLTDRQTDRQTDRWTDRRTDRQLSHR